eukprot:2377873-Rhodomonas_salina.2
MDRTSHTVWHEPNGVLCLGHCWPAKAVSTRQVKPALSFRLVRASQQLRQLRQFRVLCVRANSISTTPGGI